MSSTEKAAGWPPFAFECLILWEQMQSILRRYRKVLFRLATLLEALSGDPENRPALWQLQLEIIKQIKRSERGAIRNRKLARELKALVRKGRHARDDALRLKKRIKSALSRADDYRFAIYIFKCFGDGIAFIYLDSFALKHTYYKTTDYSVREEPSYITESAGFEQEVRAAKQLLDTGIPVVLCDITNVIRYGDICGLFTADPVLIEVKSSGNQNQRTIRQRENLDDLINFYANDGADDFRGGKNVIRHALQSPPATYESCMKDLINRALSEGTAWHSPEPGLLYLVTRTEHADLAKMQDAVSEFSSGPSQVFFLNEAKNERTWLPMRPFTLSLSAAHVPAFITGEISLMVLIDLGVMKWLFAEHGASVQVLSDNDYALQVILNSNRPQDGIFRVSHQIFARIAFEFWSLKWFVEEQSNVTMPDNPPFSKDIGEFKVPAEWLRLDDGIKPCAPNLKQDRCK